MRSLSLVAVIVFICMTATGLNLQTRKGNNLPLSEGRSFSKTEQGDETHLLPSATHRYRLDPSQSKFTAHALAGGLLWFKGQDHIIAIRDFTGEAQLTAGSINPASLQINAKAASMVETSDVFTEQEKQIINRELREIVLHPDQYPEIIFRSTSITGRTTSSNQYELKITGDLTLHGVTRQITIPTTVNLAGNGLRARGEFAIKRSDFKVKATSAMHGLIRVKDKVKFTYAIVGHERE
ncbi:MAG TPA: YceI family protein [Pyrinomonadaceae bacterium]|nr:YceI family protein [Pyrinomonadaceae bacterium]